MKVKELLSDESKWCKGFAAKNFTDEAVDPHSDKAIRWCLAGAIAKCYFANSKCYFANSKPIWTKVEAYIQEHYGNEFISFWNDRPSRTFEDVKKLVDELDI